MKKLSEKEWKPKKLTDDFRPVRGRESNMAMLELGNVPLISAKNGSNGVKGFVNTPKKLVDGGCITLNNDGDGGAGLAYYQSTEMALDTHVTALIPRTDMKPAAMLFASECISELHGFFGHGLSISNKRVKNIKVMFPVTDSGKPDYDYMAEYTKQMREKLLAKYREYAEKRIAELGEEVEIPALSEKEWKAFSVSDLFSIQLARGDNQLASAECGQTPLVSAGTKSNGVIGFITNGDDGSLFTGDYITVDMFGQTFYQPFSFYAVSHGRLNMLSNDDIPASAKSFIAVCTNVQNKDKYSYNQMCSSKRLARQKLMLPVTDSGEPHYEYMEQYVKNIMLRKYKQYMTFLEKKSQKQTNI